MIAVDTSALFAILNAEEDAGIFAHRLIDDDQRHLSSASFVELGTICLTRLHNGMDALERLMDELSIRVMVFDEKQALFAIDAYERFGKGRRSRARLNLGDCFSYALAKSLDAPLLYKGDDFAHTDIRSALAA